VCFFMLGLLSGQVSGSCRSRDMKGASSKMREMEQLTVGALRKACIKRRVPLYGRKDQIVARLLALETAGPTRKRAWREKGRGPMKKRPSTSQSGQRVIANGYITPKRRSRGSPPHQKSVFSAISVVRRRIRGKRFDPFWAAVCSLRQQTILSPVRRRISEKRFDPYWYAKMMAWSPRSTRRVLSSPWHQAQSPELHRRPAGLNDLDATISFPMKRDLMDLPDKMLVSPPPGRRRKSLISHSPYATPEKKSASRLQAAVKRKTLDKAPAERKRKRLRRKQPSDLYNDDYDTACRDDKEMEPAVPELKKRQNRIELPVREMIARTTRRRAAGSIGRSTPSSQIVPPTLFEECFSNAAPAPVQLMEPVGSHAVIQLTGQPLGNVVPWMQVYSSVGSSPHHGQPSYTSLDGHYSLYYSGETRTKGWWVGRVVGGTISDDALAFLPQGKHEWWVLEESGTLCEAQVIITAVPPPQIPNQAPGSPKQNLLQPGAFQSTFGNKDASPWKQLVQKEPLPKNNSMDETCIVRSRSDSQLLRGARGGSWVDEYARRHNGTMPSPMQLVDFSTDRGGKLSYKSAAAMIREFLSGMQSPSSDSRRSTSTRRMDLNQPTQSSEMRGRSSSPHVRGTNPTTRDHIADKIAQMAAGRITQMAASMPRNPAQASTPAPMTAKIPRTPSSPSLNIACSPTRQSAKDIGLCLSPNVLTPADSGLLDERDAAQQDALLRSLFKYSTPEPMSSPSKYSSPTRSSEPMNSPISERRSSNLRSRTDLRSLSPDMRIAMGLAPGA